MTEVLNFRDAHNRATLSEKEGSLRNLTAALLAGNGDDAKQTAYAALAKGNNEREILDVIVEAVDIISDLQELGKYDQTKLSSLESAINASLQVLEEWLAKSEGKFNVKVTVGPVGLRTGALPSLALSASLRSVGFRSTNLAKTQTALDLLRNSEELDANLVVAILAGDGEDNLLAFAEAYERGGFKNKFQIIAMAPGLPDTVHSDVSVARNLGEAISKATEWALRIART